MSAKNYVAHKGVLLTFLILLFIFVIVRPVNKFHENQLTALPNNIADTNQIPGMEELSDPNLLEHRHPAFKERLEERQRMVATQIAARDVNDLNVLQAMRIVPRHFLVRSGEQNSAYADSALPIDYNQTISQPYIVGFMTQALHLDPNSKVLEIGTGSGYQAAVCAEIAREVYTIEIVEGLAKKAEEKLKELGYTNVFVKYGDGFFGWQEHAPYDAIIGTAATGRVPEPLIEQLKPEGVMIIPLDTESGYQELEVITKDDKGNIQKENVLSVQFVPMTGQVQKPVE